MKNGFRGYIGSRSVNGSTIPQRIQNMVIRQYAQSKGLTFLLSATEYYMDRCYMMLEAIIKEEARELEGVIFYSITLMPEDRDRRFKIYDGFFSQGCEMHFALENLVVKNKEDVVVLEEVLMTRTTAADAPARVRSVMQHVNQQPAHHV